MTRGRAVSEEIRKVIIDKWKNGNGYFETIFNKKTKMKSQKRQSWSQR